VVLYRYARSRMLLCHARDRHRSTLLSCNVCCMALYSSVTVIDQGPNTLYPCLRRGGGPCSLAISSSASSGGPSQRPYRSTIKVQVEAPYYSYTYLAHIRSPTPQSSPRGRIADHSCTATRSATGLMHTGTQWTTRHPRIVENRLNKRYFRTWHNALERTQAN
jgi:hypothetical protein